MAENVVLTFYLPDIFGVSRYVCIWVLLFLYDGLLEIIERHAHLMAIGFSNIDQDVVGRVIELII